MPALGYSPGTQIATQLPSVSSTGGDLQLVHCVGLVQISQLLPQAINFHKKDGKLDKLKISIVKDPNKIKNSSTL